MTRIFVFGSNLAGRHGRGAALYARNHHGAIYGQGVGRQGDSYAIPTKDKFLHSLPLDEIYQHIADFLTYAREHPDLTFKVTPIGCGLAGFNPWEIAPGFKDSPENVALPAEFLEVLADD